MNILFLGEIIGKGGVLAIKEILPKLKKQFNFDLIIANANSVTGGFGLGKNHALYLRKLGINFLIGGDAIFLKKDLSNEIDQFNFVLRPANLTPVTKGKGIATYYHHNNKIGLINMLGLAGSSRMHANNPFTYTQELLKNRLNQNSCNLLTFCALATAEKQTMIQMFAGLTPAIIGYGAKVLTNDAKIIKGTATITDCGRVGSRDSVVGFDKQIEIEKFLTARPLKSKEALDNIELNAVAVALDTEFKATTIELIQHFL